MVSWISLHGLCLPPTSHSSSTADIVIYLQFPHLATFPQSGSLCQKRPSLCLYPPLHPSPTYPSLLTTHLADSSSSLRRNLFHLDFPGGSDSEELARNAGDLGWKDPLEKEMATQFSILAWRIPWTEKPGGLQSMGLQRVGHDWATNIFTFHFHSHTGVMFPPGGKTAGQPGLDAGAEWMTVIDLQEPQRKNYLFLLYFLGLYFHCSVDPVCWIYLFFWTNFGKPSRLPVANQS